MLTEMADKHPNHPQLERSIEFKDRLKQTIDRLCIERTDPRYSNVSASHPQLPLSPPPPQKKENYKRLSTISLLHDCIKTGALTLQAVLSEPLGALPFFPGLCS